MNGVEKGRERIEMGAHGGFGGLGIAPPDGFGHLAVLMRECMLGACIEGKRIEGKRIEHLHRGVVARLDEQLDGGADERAV